MDKNNKITNQNDLSVIIDNVILSKFGLVNHHISSMNEFNLKGIKQIVTRGFKIEIDLTNERDITDEDNQIDKYFIEILIEDIELTPPTTEIYDKQREQILTPNHAHLNDLTYSAPMYIDAKIIVKVYKKNGIIETKEDKINHYHIGKIPIMVKSKLCNTYNKSDNTLINLNEDPKDLGGYMIIKGNEWVIDSIETMIYNSSRIFKNVGHRSELARGDFISKPGDGFENSAILYTKLLTNFNIIFEITNNKLKEIKIPFYLLFRAFGANSDKEIIEYITLTTNPSKNDITTKKILEILENSFVTKYDDMHEAGFLINQNDVLEYLGQKINAQFLSSINKINTNIKKYSVSNVLKILDKDILPHIGLSPSARLEKMRFLGYLLNRLLLVHLNILESSDRDSYHNKRINSAGISYAKIFKTRFNFSIVQPLKKSFTREFKHKSFSLIDLKHTFTTAISSSSLEKELIQAITTGDKTITKHKGSISSYLSSQQLHRKNQINVINVLRNINTKSTTSAKQSARANEMRRFHPSMIGAICCVQSADTGEKVGMQKQMAISTTITSASSSEWLKSFILQNNDIIPLDELKNEEIYNKSLGKVFVNGYWLGCSDNINILANKYREYRKNKKIHYLTTIQIIVETNELFFWCDSGRMVRPLIIVYNNFNEINGDYSKFKQYIKLTNEHLIKLQNNEINIDNLVDEKIIEFIGSSEQINCVIAENLDELLTNENNVVLQYTHLDIPLSIVGLSALTSPFANHNQVARVVFQTNQVKQTCGIPCLNFYYKAYKEMYVQQYNEMPVVKTLTNNYIDPIGLNTIVAISIYGGYNQEDSLVVNQGAINRGLFTTYHFTFEKTELEKNEEFLNPNPLETSDIKAYSNYEKLVNGVVPIGTYIEYGDVIIGKVFKLPKQEIIGNYKYTDRSIIYKNNEPVYVWNIIKGRNEDGNQFYKVVFKSKREVEIGNKFCVSKDHEVLTNKGWVKIDKITTNDKLATLKNGVIEYEYPQYMNKWKYSGPLYEVKNKDINITCTLNHKFYIKENNKYHLKEIYRIANNSNYTIKKNGLNFNCVVYDTTFLNTKIVFSSIDLIQFIAYCIYFNTMIKDEKLVLYVPFNDNYNQENFIKLIDRMNIKNDLDINVYHKNNYFYYHIGNKNIINYFNSFYNDDGELTARHYLNLTYEESRAFIDVIFYNELYTTSFKELSDNIQIIAINAEFNCNIISSKKWKTTFILKLLNTKNDLEPTINKTSKLVNKKNCYIYCPTLSTGIFMIRKNGIAHWTGNSSRAGQKGTVGMIYREGDMPFSESGMKPDIIFNPHSLPSRMTMSIIIEAMMSKYCAVKGMVYDGTMFKKIDIDNIAELLKTIGFNYNGTERLYNGFSGKYIDTEIFIGPIYYQNLQKFTIDTLYSHKTCPTDVLVRQPLDGKRARGGLRLGEMETDVLAISSIKFLQEKMINHSDKFTIYICKVCNRRAIVNEEKHIYKCQYCKDNADICKVDSTWSVKLMLDEIESMNCGVKLITKKNEYEENSN